MQFCLQIQQWLYVWCCSDDRDTTSTSSVSCSPRWIVYPQSQAFGADRVEVRTQRQCLDRCVSDTRCVAVAWADGCWHHRNGGYPRRHYHAYFTNFDIVRQCNPMSGSCRQQAVILLFNWNSCFEILSDIVSINNFIYFFLLGNLYSTAYNNKKLSWCWQTRSTSLEVSQGHQT